MYVHLGHENNMGLAALENYEITLENKHIAA